ncbi:MAG: putative maltokinase [Labilithrix sp.]|nr:putative maltokinase [Labilithrix sp.]
MPTESVLEVPSRWDALFDAPSRAALERALPAWIAARRWFRSKSKRVESAHVVAAFSMPFHADGSCDPRASHATARVALVDVVLDDEARETYVLPLAFVCGERAARFQAARPHAIVMPLRVKGGETGLVVDALALEGFLGELLVAIQRGATFEDAGAALRFAALGVLETAGETASLVDREQTNTSVIFGERFVGKIVRKIEPGESPALEVGRFLTGVGYAHAPALAGFIEVERPGAPASTLGLLHVLVPNRGDAWEHALGSLAQFLVAPSAERIDVYATLAEKLGRRVGEMHVALTSRVDVAGFVPEPLDAETRASIAKAVRIELGRVLEALGARSASLSDRARAALADVRANVKRLEDRLAEVASLADAGVVSRVHGDLHLGQVLFTGDDFALVDFEGEPARTMEERKAKRSPLVDVAGMIRSFHYASSSALRAHPVSSPPAPAATASPAELTAWATRWQRDASAAFLRGWRAAVIDTIVMPANPAATTVLLDLFLVEKAIYEAHYELDNRPDWIDIPLEGLSELLT